MALPVISGLTRVSISGTTINGTPWVNVIHLRYTGGGDPTTTNQLVAQPIIEHLYSGAAYTGGANMLSFCHPGLVMTDISFLNLDGISATLRRPVSHVGTSAAADPLPASTSAVVKLGTLERGRNRRGRVYLPPWTEAHSDGGGHITTADRALVINQWGGFQTDLQGNSWELVVASYLGSGSWRLVQAYDMDLYFKSQRRRRV